MMTAPGDRRRFLQDARSFCRRVDGLVLIDTFVSVEGDSADAFFDRPAVAVGERLDGASSITIDNRAAARRAVEHLTELGHARIGLVAGPPLPDLPTPVPEQRRLGYEDALRAAGLPVDPDLAVGGEWTAAGGAAALSSLLDLTDPPTAVFCMSDEMAFGVLRAAAKTGSGRARGSLRGRVRRPRSGRCDGAHDDAPGGGRDGGPGRSNGAGPHRRRSCHRHHLGRAPDWCGRRRQEPTRLILRGCCATVPICKRLHPWEGTMKNHSRLWLILGALLALRPGGDGLR